MDVACSAGFRRRRWSACRMPARSMPRSCSMPSPASACSMPARRRVARPATCSSARRASRAGRAGYRCGPPGPRAAEPAATGAARDPEAGGPARGSGWWDGRPFDRILLDAPCSGTGVIRRHPDIKLLRRPGDIAGFAATQRRLLARCAGDAEARRPAGLRHLLDAAGGKPARWWTSSCAQTRDSRACATTVHAAAHAPRGRGRRR